MAIQFNKLKSELLGLEDKIPRGKLQDCRVCDVVQDHWEYLEWTHSKQYIMLMPIALAAVRQAKSRHDYDRHYREEVLPWSDEDIPF